LAGVQHADKDSGVVQAKGAEPKATPPHLGADFSQNPKERIHEALRIMEPERAFCAAGE